MIITIVYPSSAQFTGGVNAMYEFANGLARRGQEVHVVHGPAWPGRVESVEEVPFRFEPEVVQHVVDDLEDPSLPHGDVVFPYTAPRRLGLPAVFVQGYGLLASGMEDAAILSRAPKVCIARWLVEVAASKGAPREQLWHVPYGIDHSVFTPPPPDRGRQVDVACLYHPHPEKGWSHLVSALETLRERRPSLSVRAFAIAEPEASIPDWIDLRIGLDHEALVEHVYREAKVFVQASIREGFGFTPVEAMACGAALVSTDNGGSADYAIDGDTALVVPPGDAAALTEAMDRLLEDRVSRDRIAVAGERYVRRFDWDRSAELLESHLERYVEDPEAFRAPGSPVDHRAADRSA